jgi:hypothetical protein
MSAIGQTFAYVPIEINFMSYSFVIKRSAYDYLRVTGNTSALVRDGVQFVAIHLNRKSFIKSLNSAELDPVSRGKLLESCTRAWNFKGIEILCEGVELTPEQISFLRMAPHISTRHENLKSAL